MKILLIPAILGLIHFGYILIAIFNFYKDKAKRKSEDLLSYNEFSIEHIICLKNESRFILEKLHNCYALSYPKIHHTFINDNSTDDTLELLEKHKKDEDTIINNKVNKGKNQSQISAVNQSESDLLLFTDANVFLTDDSIENLLQSFNRQEVGGACGDVTITTDMKHQDLSGKYWKLETIIKRFQSKIGSTIGFDGGYYCVRRENYNLKRENELSDFETAFLIFEQQKQCVFNASATATELEKRKIQDSFKARMRASNRVFWSYSRIFKYIHRLPKSVLVHFMLHKLIRYSFIVSFVISLP
ncbi:glycosyltransferase, partial [bacterium]|nr:glycosyltransferase [bacterium]